MNRQKAILTLAAMVVALATGAALATQINQIDWKTFLMLAALFAALASVPVLAARISCLIRSLRTAKSCSPRSILDPRPCSVTLGRYPSPETKEQ